MRTPIGLVIVCLLAGASLIARAPAAAPPPRDTARIQRLIDALGDEDEDARKQASHKLENLGAKALPALRKAGKSHPDADVLLRATLLASAIEQKLAGFVRLCKGHTQGIIALAVSPDGKRVVSGSWAAGTEHVARVWEVQTGKELFQLDGHSGGIFALAWSRDGKWIASSSFDRTVRIWNAKTLAEHRKLTVSQEGCEGVAFTPDARQVLAASAASALNVSVWDVATGVPLRRYDGHTQGALGVAVTPDGKYVVSCAKDGTMRLWPLPRKR
jgi:WD40 repeat protein